MGSTKEFLPGTTTVTGSFPNRKERRAAEKKAAKEAEIKKRQEEREAKNPLYNPFEHTGVSREFKKAWDEAIQKTFEAQSK
jgi:hypothetical protein